MTGVYLLKFLGLEVQEPGVCKAGFSWGPSPWLAGSYPPVASSHGCPFECALLVDSLSIMFPLKDTSQTVFRSHPNSLISTCMLVAQSYLTQCDPMDCSPPGFSVHELLHAIILEWTAMPSSRGSSGSRDRTWVSCIAGRLYHLSHKESLLVERWLLTYHLFKGPMS